MKFREILPADHSAFLALYNEAFPPEERRVYADETDFGRFVEDKTGRFHVMVAEDENGEFVGFLSYWSFPGFLYVEHFAISPLLRGKGAGRQMLQHLVSTVSPDVLLEVELPETDQARRRIRFYESNGFITRPEIDYVQPPYAPGLPSLPLLLMTHGNVDINGMADLREMWEAVYNVAPAD